MIRIVAQSLFTAFVVTAMTFLAATPAVSVAEAPTFTFGEIPGFGCEEVEPSDAELEMLPGDTRVAKRIYRANDGNWHLVTLVIGGKTKSSIHRPELCRPAQGALMRDPRTREIGGCEWRLITLAREGETTGLAYTFFNQEGFRTCSHTRRIFRDIWDRSVLNRIDRWAMVTVDSTTTDERKVLPFLERLMEEGRR